MTVMISNKFAELLKEKKVRIATISADTGLSRTTLTNLYYQRNIQISFDVLDRLCNYLECQIDDIIEYVPGEMNAKKE